ncbi:unnamed protein product [Heligmosomoides polygyrus]|uniref:Prothymosin alpha n=1 Tax=Heligmosomoides polygyrus TaxID=6339 RepID=A0A183G2K6_HELPZ|nr:unnamed protein product [Heligmosomoides polygyrus]
MLACHAGGSGSFPGRCSKTLIRESMSAEDNANAAPPGPEMEEEMKDAEDVEAEHGEERKEDKGEQSNLRRK